MGTQSIIVQLQEDLAREVRRHLGSSGRGYASLNEFVEVALMNQLAAETAGRPSSYNSGSSKVAIPANTLGSVVRTEPPPDLMQSPPSSMDALFVLTNRLGPMKIATRVLANMRRGGWPHVREFQEEAAQAAREVGLRLRDEDLAEARRGAARRWVAFPVGEDTRAALDRFVVSFTVSASDGRASGPMAVLGLANVANDRVALTAAGWSLAVAPSPLIDGSGHGRLSAEEAGILRQQIRQAPAELAAVREFLSLVRRSAGSQPRLDELLAARHADWTSHLAIAHRSAMLGRLGDVGALEVTGRGPQARVQVLPAAHEFELEADIAKEVNA